MSLKIDRVQLEIVIKGDQTRAELTQLEAKAKLLSKELRGMKEGTAEYVAKSNELKQVRMRMDELIDGIGLAGLTMKELISRQKELNAVLRNLDPRTAEYKKYSDQLSQINGRIGELRGHTQNAGFNLSSLANGFNKYWSVVAAGAAALTGVVLTIKQFISGAAEIADKMADVAKTTNLSTSEVQALNQELKKIDTRTSQKELLGLAEVAGKIGMSSKNDVLEFVRAADKINVALGEDLGGNAEEALNAVGKIVDIFGVRSEFGIEKGMLKVGSAINSIGQASTASEAYLVDFTKRLGGIAPLAGISVDKVLGLAGTLDQLGQQAETSSTAVSQVFVAMGNRIDVFAKIANMNIKDFAKLLKADANEALIKVLEGLKKNSGGLQAMSQAMDGLKLEGSRAIGVVGVLANNVDVLRQQQSLASKEFDKGTSIMTEFNIKNNNLAANLEKLAKIFSQYFTNGALARGFSSLIDSVTKWFEIPISQKMEEERVSLRKLELKLYDVNTKTEDRINIIKELQNKYPGFLENVDAERATNAELAAAINRVNDALINKIILQKHDEKIDEQNTEIAEARLKLMSEEDNLREKIVKGIKEEKFHLNLQGMTIEQMVKTYRDAYYAKYKLASQEVGLWTYGPALERVNELEKTNNGLLNEREKLIDRLGIKTEEFKKKSDTTTKTPEQLAAEAKKIEDDEQKRLDEEKKTKDLYAELEKIALEHANWNKNQDEIELRKLDFKYKELREKAENNGKALAEINKLYYEERDQMELDQLERRSNDMLATTEAQNLREKADKIKANKELLDIEKNYWDLKKEYGLATIDQMVDYEIEALESAASYDVLTTEQQEIAKSQIREKYGIHYMSANKKETGTILGMNRNVVNEYLQGASMMTIATQKFFKEGSKQYRALALLQLGIDTAMAISALTARSEENIANAVTFGGAGILQWASGIARIMANIAMAREYMNGKGFAKGGYTGSGEMYEPAGMVHKGEYVVSQSMMKNPFVMNMLPIMEAIRTNRSLMGTQSATQQNQVIVTTDPATVQLLQEINRKLDNPTRAKVVLSDLDDATKLRDDIRKSVTA